MPRRRQTRSRARPNRLSVNLHRACLRLAQNFRRCASCRLLSRHNRPKFRSRSARRPAPSLHIETRSGVRLSSRRSRAAQRLRTPRGRSSKRRLKPRQVQGPRLETRHYRSRHPERPPRRPCVMVPKSNIRLRQRPQLRRRRSNRLHPCLHPRDKLTARQLLNRRIRRRLWRNLRCRRPFLSKPQWLSLRSRLRQPHRRRRQRPILSARRPRTFHRKQ